MEEQMRSNQFVSENYADVIGDIEKKKQKRAKEAKQKEFEDKVLQLADKAIEFRQKRGEQDSLTILLENFLDVALQMRGIMETMTAINVAMECIGDSIGFLDAAIDFDNKLMDESLSHNYGFFSRLKAKIKMRKTIKNSCGRMEAIANGLAMKYKLTTDMMNSLTKVSDKLKISMSKAAQKAAKKAGGEVQSVVTPAQKLILERMNAKGIAPTADVTPTTDSASSSEDKAPDTGIDDII